MGIGRREFIRLVGTGITALAARPSNAVAIVEDTYINRKLGIAFQRPPGWVFADVREMGQVKAGQILDIEDVELSQEILDAAGLPILTISRDRISADSDTFTPGITVFLDRIEPNAEAEGEGTLEPTERFEADVEFCDRVLKEFRVVSSPVAKRISDCPASEYEASFIFEHANMRPTPVRMKALAIDQGKAFYTLRMYDSPYKDVDMQFDYRPFIATVMLV